MDLGTTCTINGECLSTCCMYNACTYESYCQMADHWRVWLSVYIVVGVFVSALIILLLYCIVKKLNENSRQRDAIFVAYMSTQ